MESFKVLCIDNCLVENFLTVGREYVVVESTKDPETYSHMFHIPDNDDGLQHKNPFFEEYFSSLRFKRID